MKKRDGLSILNEAAQVVQKKHSMPPKKKPAQPAEPNEGSPAEEAADQDEMSPARAKASKKIKKSAPPLDM